MLLSSFQKNKPLVSTKGLFYIVLRFSFYFFLLIFTSSFAQKEESFLIVDSNYALDLKDSQNPVIIRNTFGAFWRDIYDSKYSSIPSICDKNGNLLFYTDGNFVWNKNREIMPNGTLAGYNNSNTPINVMEQTRALILPDLNNSNQYYIIINDHIKELNSYTMIDMSLGAGNGDVIQTKKMIPFTNGNYYGDLRATGVDSCKGMWLIGRSKNTNSQMHAYKVGANNISSSPIVSTLAKNLSNSLFKTSRQILSQTGKLIALQDNDGLNCRIYSINLNSGEINFNYKYSIDITNLSTSGIDLSNFYTRALFFSDNDSNFFFCRSYNSDYKICVFSINLVNNKISIIDTLTQYHNGHPYSLNLSDSKAYIALNSYKRTGRTFPFTGTITSHNLAVINNPNGVGTNVGYNFNGIIFPDDAIPGVPYQGLVNYYGKPKPRPRITLPTQQICSQTPFSLSADVSNLPQVQSGKQIWYLNDTEVISYNPNDSYTIQEPGVYKLSFRHEECIEHTTITVTAPPVHNIPPKDSLCEGKFLQLTSTGILQIKNQLNLPISPPVSVAGNYTFTVLGCSSLLGSFGLKVTQKPNLILPNTLAGCLPLGVQLQPLFTTSLGQNLLWSNGSTAQNQSITTSGIFTITVSNRCFTEQKSTQITLLSKPILPKFPPDTTICESKNITILGNQNLQATEQGSNKRAIFLIIIFLYSRKRAFIPSAKAMPATPAREFWEFQKF